MSIRWLKRYYVIASPTRMGHTKKVLHQEKVLQIEVEGVWADIPVINDEESYKNAKTMMSEKKPILHDDKLERLEAEMEEAAVDLSQDAENE